MFHIQTRHLYPSKRARIRLSTLLPRKKWDSTSQLFPKIQKVNELSSQRESLKAVTQVSLFLKTKGVHRFVEVCSCLTLKTKLLVQPRLLLKIKDRPHHDNLCKPTPH